MDEAINCLERAALGFDRLEMRLVSAAVRSRLANLIGGEAGRDLARSETLWMEQHGVASPTRVISLYVPVGHSLRVG